MSQHMDALARANAIRFGIAAVKREVKAGTLTVADALLDERAQPMKLGALLLAQWRWGPDRVRLLCGHMLISEVRRVRDLTTRQRGEIAWRLDQEYPLDGTESSTEKAA